jgi:hypothetical protein
MASTAVAVAAGCQQQYEKYDKQDRPHHLSLLFILVVPVGSASPRRDRMHPSLLSALVGVAHRGCARAVRVPGVSTAVVDSEDWKIG